MKKITFLLCACWILQFSAVWSEERSPNKDEPPLLGFKVYSKDGRESLTALCNAKDLSLPSSSVKEITCKFINVRFILPDKRIRDKFPTSPEEAAKDDPKFAEELKRNPSAAQEWTKQMEKTMREFCAPNSETRRTLEKQMRNSNNGPKRMKRLQRMSEACSKNNPDAILKAIATWNNRTCSLWVDQFTLEFKKIGKGRWLYTQERPGGFSKIVKIYELECDRSVLCNLIETRVPMEGTTKQEGKVEPKRTAWSWKNYKEYELPSQCDFISHDMIQVSILQ